MKLPQIPTFANKPFRFIRGYVLAFGYRIVVGRKFTNTLLADMSYMCQTGSPYSALTMARLAGIDCKEATDALAHRRQENRERSARIEARRQAAQLEPQIEG